MTILLSIVALLVGSVGGYLLGKRNRKYDERARLESIEQEERSRQIRKFKDLEKEEENKIILAKRERTAASTRAALDFGYTMQQVLDWAYSEVYFNDFELERPRLLTERTYTHGAKYETQEKTTNRRLQARYGFLRKVLTGTADQAALDQRDILEALRVSIHTLKKVDKKITLLTGEINVGALEKDGIETSTEIYKGISGEGVVEDVISKAKEEVAK